MKKFLLLSVCCIVLLACKKQNQSALPEKSVQPQPKYPVSFNLTGFTQTTNPITNSTGKTTLATTVPLSRVINNIYYMVYDSNGNQVSRLEQDSYNANTIYRITKDAKRPIATHTTFGTITDSLQAGEYTVVAVGGQSGLKFSSPTEGTAVAGQDLYPEATFSQSAIYFDSIGETFMYKGPLRMINGFDNQMNLTLNRILGQLEINIEDAMPANAAWVQFTIGTEFSVYRLATNLPSNQGQKMTSIWPVSDNDKGKTNFTMTKFVLNTVIPFEVVIQCLDANRKVIAQKTVPMAQVKVNQRTILTGKLFDKVSEAGFKVTVDPAWGSNGTTVKF